MGTKEAVTVWPEGYGRFVLSSVGSTLDTAREMAAVTPAPFWVLAQRQTAARGRRGRAWAMPEGNFAATLWMRTEDDPARIALRSFVMSLALWQSFVEVTGREAVFSLKWPNDVLLKGGKVAGILLESGGSGEVALGVGVNLVGAPGPADVEAGAVRPVSLLWETSVRVSPEAFLSALAHHYALLEQQFRDYGFEPIRAGWMERAAKRGEVITARTGRAEIVGVFEDVDADGQLVLRGPNGLTRVAAADVFF